MNRSTRSAIWIVVALVGGYIFAQVLADVAATKIVSVFGFAIPAGTFIFAFTFTLRDMLHKQLGKEWARASIVAAAALNLFMAGYLAWVASLEPAPFWPWQEAWAAIFGLVPRIVLASIAAELISELVDTEVYHRWRARFRHWPQWTRVASSNAISLPLDSLIFVTIAFAGTLPLAGLLAVVWGQIIFKTVVTVVSLPAIYLVRERPGTVTVSVEEAASLQPGN